MLEFVGPEGFGAEVVKRGYLVFVAHGGHCYDFVGVLGMGSGDCVAKVFGLDHCEG